MHYLEARISGSPIRWPLRRKEITIGRDTACDVVVDDPSVSRRHVELHLARDGGVTLNDLGSTNGVWVAGQRTPTAKVQADEWFAVGSVLMTVRRGVSLTNDTPGERAKRGIDSPRVVTAPQRRIPTLPGTHPPGAADSGLAAVLAGDDDPVSVIHDLLELTIERCGCSGALLVRRVGNGLAVIAAAGEPLPAAAEDELLTDGSTNGGSSTVRWFVIGSDRDTRLVVHPGECARPLDEILGTITALLHWLLRVENADITPVAPSPRPVFDDTNQAETFLTRSRACKDLLSEIDQLAATELPVLIHGESGTGKEILARRLHDHSHHAGGPFVAINCAALPAELLEAEIFGIQSGVATGVSARPGRMRQAGGGTLFLDEIGDLPRALQPKLLRALESGEIVPLGAPAPIPVNVRFVSASHQDLRSRVGEGHLRDDLFHRLAGAVISVPPLRDRPEDVLPLVRRFARRLAADQGRQHHGLDLEATRILLGYSWPGNVRELLHVVQRAIALADGPILHADLLPAAVRQASDRDRGDALLGPVEDYRTARTRFDRYYFQQLLELCNGNIAEASRRAGLHRVYVHRKLRDLELR